jgi:hypothetical protein
MLLLGFEWLSSALDGSVRYTPWLLYARSSAVTHWTGGWKDPRIDLPEVAEKKPLVLARIETRSSSN